MMLYFIFYPHRILIIRRLPCCSCCFPSCRTLYVLRFGFAILNLDAHAGAGMVLPSGGMQPRSGFAESVVPFAETDLPTIWPAVRFCHSQTPDLVILTAHHICSPIQIVNNIKANITTWYLVLPSSNARIRDPYVRRFQSAHKSKTSMTI